jgi:hypothetical protein
MGLMQIMPQNAKAWGMRNPHDPQESVEYGARYLSDLLLKYKGNVMAALAEYNGGPENGSLVAGGKSPNNAETANYLRKVIENMPSGSPDRGKAAVQVAIQESGIKGAGPVSKFQLEQKAKEDMEIRADQRKVESEQRAHDWKVQEEIANPTDAQAQALGFLKRMQNAEGIMGQVPNEATMPGSIENVLQGMGGAGEQIANHMRSANRQLARQAQEDWVRAKLRKESGAVIADTEMASEIRLYFPQPGDSPQVQEQKKAARKQAEVQLGLQTGRKGAAETTTATAPGRLSGNITQEEYSQLHPGSEFTWNGKTYRKGAR